MQSHPLRKETGGTDKSATYHTTSRISSLKMHTVVSLTGSMVTLILYQETEVNHVLKVIHSSWGVSLIFKFPSSLPSTTLASHSMLRDRLL